MINTYRVLIADDFEIIRKIHITNLKKCDITNITEASNGKEVLELVQSKQFDLIILDWHMPEMSGYEALVALRKDGFSQPIIICTDEVDQDKLTKAKKVGASEIIKKPYSPSKFKSIITKLL